MTGSIPERATASPDSVSSAPRAAIAILADDLIWASRLADSVAAAGGEARRVRTVAGLRDAIAGGAALAIVDLTARAYDGVDAVSAASAAGARVLAVGQHDDHDLRRRALAAGAERVYAYRKLFEAGPAVLRAWLGTPSTAAASAAGPGRSG